MRYKVEELEEMSEADLIKTYREAKTSIKREILISLANNKKFAILMNRMNPAELEQMAKIHPYKEVVVDTMIDEMESHGMKMAKNFDGNSFQKESFSKFMDALQHKSFFAKIKEALTRKPTFPESLPKKIEQVKKLCELEVRRTNATGRKIEDLETKDLDQAVDESRVEVNNGEMAKMFDKYAKEARKEGKFLQVPQIVKEQLTQEYMSTLGEGREDIARLVAAKEFESYSGEQFYVPYKGVFSAQSYGSQYNESIAGPTDNRGWQKNLLEIEQVQDFTVGDHNLGEVFIVKSEFSPTSYAVEGKWAPIYEYYTKDENNEMVRIGSAKINQKTGKMETTISIDRQDISDDIMYETEELTKAKEDGMVIQFDSSEYTGKSTKTSRKDIEQAITTKAIKAYLGQGKQIADVTQIKDMPVITYDEKGNPQTKNAYIVACVENGVESYEMVCIDQNGKCDTYPGMNKDMFSNKEMHFPTGMSTGYDRKTSFNVLNKKQALETFKSRDGVQYSAYRDQDGTLRIAQMIERANGNGKYAEELDTYSVMHGDIEKMKAQSKDEYDLALTLSKESEKSTGLSLENKEDDLLSL